MECRFEEFLCVYIYVLASMFHRKMKYFVLHECASVACAWPRMAEIMLGAFCVTNLHIARGHGSSGHNTCVLEATYKASTSFPFPLACSAVCSTFWKTVP